MLAAPVKVAAVGEAEVAGTMVVLVEAYGEPVPAGIAAEATEEATGTKDAAAEDGTPTAAEEAEHA